MDIKAFQSRMLARLGDDLTNTRFTAAFDALIREASAVRRLLDLDGGDPEKVSDDDLVGLLGGIFLPATEVACVLGVDLERALEWGERAAEARATWSQAADDARLVSWREES